MEVRATADGTGYSTEGLLTDRFSVDSSTLVIGQALYIVF